MTVEDAITAYRQVLKDLHALAEERDQFMIAHVPALPHIAQLNLQIAAQRAVVKAAREALATALGGP